MSLEDFLVDTVTINSAVTFDRTTGQVPPQDPGGGFVQQYIYGTTPIPCSVRPGSATRTDDHTRDSSEIRITVYFATTQSIHVKDQLVWTIRDGESLADPITGNCPLITLDGRTTASPRSNGPFMVTGVIRTLK